MSCTDIGLIVIGGLNTDIVALGVDRLLSPGELTRSGRLLIGPGGKSCNLARMSSPLIAPRRVVMVGRTSRDPFGLWRVPLDALAGEGVNTDFVKVDDFEGAGGYPGVALIPVTQHGENQIYCVPGINDSFLPRDMDAASQLFTTRNGERMLALTLELPLQTAAHAMRMAVSSGMKVILDPGGINEGEDYRGLLGLGPYLLVPNEHEARILTGIEVTGMASAREAAHALFAMGAANVVLTHGERGAYVFDGARERHIAAPPTGASGTADATGCGDQVTAVLCAEILLGVSVMEASEAAVLAGTLQYHRPGIQPVTREELEEAMRREERS
ncbi:MAG: bifunctional hydroxymethylpyrimidine kinase/phosphomethylpyrimidine kinase [Actinobacteria bacterium]|nr:bifunctional hydroxymethylpyrimidine kinase/phosphomethylpyrimidine kinase [Actinomycetota bacterium]